MTPELDRKLVDAFPKLYAARQSRASNMRWGFACGDGWFDILWRLSEKLEQEIEKIGPVECFNCGHSLAEHPLAEKRLKVQAEGQPVREMAVQAACPVFTPGYLHAVQVKEKFGSLRFYMSGGSDEMWRLIHEAESESEHVCEDCGKPGVLREGSWLRTLCDEHAGGREPVKD